MGRLRRYGPLCVKIGTFRDLQLDVGETELEAFDEGDHNRGSFGGLLNRGELTHALRADATQRVDSEGNLVGKGGKNYDGVLDEK